MRNRCFVIILLASIVVLAGSLCAQQMTSVGNLPIAELQKLADDGDPAAQNELGVRYRLGADVDRNDELAMDWFRKAAFQHYGKALFNIGAAYYNGNDPGTRGTALYWFLLADEAGDWSGKQALAEMKSEGYTKDLYAAYVAVGDGYVKGTDIKQDYARGLQWYQRGADRENGAACHRIALLYANGWGVPKDNTQIIHWLQRGADLGDPLASYDLGKAFERGQAVAKDPQRAEKLYENAALYNNSNAMLAMGNLYENGELGNSNPQKALMWFLLAAKYGNAEAREKLTALSAKLKPTQVQHAKEDAARYVTLRKQPLSLIAR